MLQLPRHIVRAALMVDIGMLFSRSKVARECLKACGPCFCPAGIFIFARFKYPSTIICNDEPLSFIYGLFSLINT